jgi:hypothetical protein
MSDPISGPRRPIDEPPRTTGMTALGRHVQQLMAGTDSANVYGMAHRGGSPEKLAEAIGKLSPAERVQIRNAALALIQATE